MPIAKKTPKRKAKAKPRAKPAQVTTGKGVPVAVESLKPKAKKPPGGAVAGGKSAFTLAMEDRARRDAANAEFYRRLVKPAPKGKG